MNESKCSSITILAAALFLFSSVSAQAQLVPGQPRPATSTVDTSSASTANVNQQQLSTAGASPFLGSVPSGQKTAETLQVSLQDAINRGLKYNLGMVVGQQGTQFARGVRLKNLSDLLPKLTTRTGETIQQVNLAVFGIPLPAGTPSVVGPFSIFDTRASLGQPVLDLHALNNTRSATEEVKAADLNVRDARETVVLVVANFYLQLLATQARVESAKAQSLTAEAIYKQSIDLRNSGVAAGIDVLRAQVQLQSRSQRLLAFQNDFEKQKISLARAIGLPPGQQFVLSDRMPDAPPQPISVENAIADAYLSRADYKRAEALLRSAELARKAALAEALPSVRFDGDYGVIGRTPGNSHGTFSAALSLQVPIFQGGKVRGDVEQADATLAQRKAELEDFRGRIDAEVRSNYYDIETAAKQLQVARTTVELAGQELTQARDRFSTGVANSLEVTQAQESVAAANEDFITSRYALNYSQALLARSVGVAEQKIKQFLGER